MTLHFLKQIYSICAMSRQNLYHATVLENAYEILKSNTMNLGADGKIYFTRNPYLGDDPYLDFGEDDITVRFELDAESLRNNLKIYPDVTYQDGPKLNYNRELSQEIIKKPIKNFKKYLKSIFVRIDLDYIFIEDFDTARDGFRKQKHLEYFLRHPKTLTTSKSKIKKAIMDLGEKIAESRKKKGS